MSSDRIGPAKVPWIDVLPDLAVVIDYASKEIYDINTIGARALGYERAEPIGRSFRDFIDPVSDEAIAGVRARALAGQVVHFDREIVDRSGVSRTFNLAARHAPELGETMFIVTGREFAAMADSDSQLAALMKLADLTQDALVVVDRAGRVRYHSAAATKLHRRGFGVGVRVSEYLHADDTGYEELLAAADSEDQRAEARVRSVGPDGEELIIDVRVVYDPASQRWFAVERDISAIVDHERELERQALTDSLTGLANRVALDTYLADTIESGTPYAVLWLDMDDFKSVNDTFGHAVGDGFLAGIAGRIRGAVKEGDLVARLGGDEFIVVLNRTGTGEAQDISDRVIGAVGLPYALEGTTIARSCSIGIAIAASDDTTESILAKADQAAYRAKDEGRGRWVVHSADLDLRGSRYGRGGGEI